MHFPRSAPLGIPQPRIVVHIKQLLKCLLLSNLNRLLIELTFGYCFLSALPASWHSQRFRRHSGEQCGMTPPMNKASAD